MKPEVHLRELLTDFDYFLRNKCNLTPQENVILNEYYDLRIENMNLKEEIIKLKEENETKIDKEDVHLLLNVSSKDLMLQLSLSEIRCHFYEDLVERYKEEYVKLKDKNKELKKELDKYENN